MKKNIKIMANLEKRSERNKQIAGHPQVVCAVSGGMDSSVAAALLKEHSDIEVRGVFMDLWGDSYSEEAKERAKEICDRLDIPFSSFDFQDEFKKRIVEHFLSGLHKGITPNPCVKCNKEIKFGLLWEKVQDMGGDFIATGHYVRLDNEQGRIKLVRGRDPQKDQSYFLWRLNQDQLRNVLFPVGGYTKRQVKEIAEELELPVVKVPESQELCFVRHKTSDFLSKQFENKQGSIVDVEGNKLGEHQGLWFYTIGQRKGIMVSGGPYYVLKKKVGQNVLVVTKDKKDLYQRTAQLREVNWISGVEPALPLRTKAKIRYRHPASQAVLSQDGRGYLLDFKEPQFAITPGQSAVFYHGMEVIGGGIIKR